MFLAKCIEFKIKERNGHGKSRNGHGKVMEKYFVKSVGTLLYGSVLRALSVLRARADPQDFNL